jgi:DNA-binding LacI/PurR family transcriptional regulator
MSKHLDERSKSARPSMFDVARKAGVSHQTVSRVLNGSDMVRVDTRQRVETAIQELGYRRNAAARALAMNRSRTLGVVSAHLGYYGPRMITSSVSNAARQAGFEVVSLGLDSFSRDDLNTAIQHLLDRNVEAIVVAVAHRDARNLVSELALDLPVVLAEGVSPEASMAAGVDQHLGAFLATDHLLELGHDCVAHVTGPSGWIEAGQRRGGWKLAHRKRGKRIGPEVTGDWNVRSGYEAGLLLAERPQVSAIFVANDSMALGVLRAMHEAGRAVPGDVSLVGFDDLPEAEFFWPPLTTVRQDFTALGRAAVDLAVRALDGELTASAPLIPPELVVRSTTGAPQPHMRS